MTMYVLEHRVLRGTVKGRRQRWEQYAVSAPRWSGYLWAWAVQKSGASGKSQPPDIYSAVPHEAGPMGSCISTLRQGLYAAYGKFYQQRVLDRRYSNA